MVTSTTAPTVQRGVLTHTPEASRLSGQVGRGQRPAATYCDLRHNVLLDAHEAGLRVVAATWGWD